MIWLRTNYDAVFAKILLEFVHGDLAKVEDRGGKGSIDMTLGEDFEEVLFATCSSGCYDRDVQLFVQAVEGFDGETLFAAVVVHGGEEDLSCPTFLCLVCPFEEGAVGWNTSAIEVATPLTIIFQAGIDGTDALLHTKTLGNLGDEFGPANGARVDAYLIGSGSKKALYIGKLMYATTYGERNAHLGCNALYQFGEGLSALMTGCDVEIDELVGTQFAILLAQLYRIACIAEVHKLNAFDGLAIFYIEAGNDSLC